MNSVSLPLLVVVGLGVAWWLARPMSVPGKVVWWGTAVVVLAGVLAPPAVKPLAWDLLGWLPAALLDQLWPGRTAAHFVAFVWLGLLLYWVRPDLRWAGLILWLIGLAAATEVMQLFVDGRGARMSDVATNLAGATVGLVFAYLCRLFVGGGEVQVDRTQKTADEDAKWR